MLVYYNESIWLRAEVLHGNAKKTTGNLTKEDLTKNRYGKIVSKAASKAAKKTKNLGDHLAKKGSKIFVLASKDKNLLKNLLENLLENLQKNLLKNLLKIKMS